MCVCVCIRRIWCSASRATHAALPASPPPRTRNIKALNIKI